MDTIARCACGSRESLRVNCDGHMATATPVDALAEAALALYLAGRWTSEWVSVDEQARLWEALRDALGLPEGTATKAGV
jgi:hypothetical protein